VSFEEGWQTHIAIGDSFTIRIFIFREISSGEIEVMYWENEVWRMERFLQGTEFKPTFTLPLRQISILRSLAANLAQLGYAAVDTGQVTKAKDAHIASLTNELDRIERLVLRLSK